MRRDVAAGLGFAVGVAWFTLGGPAVAEALVEARVSRSPAPTAAEVRARLADPALDPAERARLEALVAAIDAAFAAEMRWNRTLATVLDADLRARGLAGLSGLPPVGRVGAPGVDADLAALALAIQERHGFDPVEVTVGLAADDWQGVDRRTRARVATVLVEDGTLDADAAGQLLAATLRLLAAQGRRAEVEAAATRGP